MTRSLSFNVFHSLVNVHKLSVGDEISIAYAQNESFQSTIFLSATY